MGIRVSDHALIRYIERIERFPIGDYYKSKTGRSIKRASEGEIIGFLQDQCEIDTNKAKRWIRQLLSCYSLELDYNVKTDGFVFVIRDGWLVTIVDKNGN